MTIEVLLFASLRDAVGEKRVRVDVPDGTSAAEVARALYRDHNLAHMQELPVRYAVDETFVPDAHVLCDGDRLAIIPPVSGG